MLTFKRNQVEEAVSRVLGESEPSVEFGTRSKRLLDADRAMGRKPRSSDPEFATYAFFSDEPPGRGVEVSFSAYEAFALLTALQLMEHGWPQSFPVRLLRAARKPLELEHARILKLDPRTLFDIDAIRAKAQPGDLYFGTTDPVLLTIASGGKADNDLPIFAICRGQAELSQFIQQHPQSWTLHELVKPAHRLAEALAKTEPKKRGRGG
jgi:hypothetical protein